MYYRVRCVPCIRMGSSPWMNSNASSSSGSVVEVGKSRKRTLAFKHYEISYWEDVFTLGIMRSEGIVARSD